MADSMAECVFTCRHVHIVESNNQQHILHTVSSHIHVLANSEHIGQYLDKYEDIPVTSILETILNTNKSIHSIVTNATTI